MSEFCVKCSVHEAKIDSLRKRHYEEMQCMQQKIDNLENDISSLSLDLAFYDGKIINLSCNNK